MRRFYLIALLLLLAAGSPIGSAALAQNNPQPPTLNEAVAQADLIFVGHVEGLEADHNAAGFIVTKVTLKILTLIKGDRQYAQGRSVVLQFAGGKIGDESLVVSHVPRLEADATYVLLIRHDGNNYASPIVGMDYGLFRVAPEPATGRQLMLTAGGNFIDEVVQGQIRAGSRARLNEQGRFTAESAPGDFYSAPTVRSLDPDKIVVLAARPIEPPVSDPARVLTLDRFVRILRNLARQ